MSDSTGPKMTVEEAVEVLNANRHRDRACWTVHESTTKGRSFKWVGEPLVLKSDELGSMIVQPAVMIFTQFEAAAIANEYRRRASAEAEELQQRIDELTEQLGKLNARP